MGNVLRLCRWRSIRQALLCCPERSREAGAGGASAVSVLRVAGGGANPGPGGLPSSDPTDLKAGASGAAGADQQSPAAGATRRRRSGPGLSAMLLSELQTLATSLGISGTGRMRKGELITAIQAKQAGNTPPAANPPA